ncbi:acyl-CoA synthetase [Frankia tisae]|uniref:acyl-CoA synthetase n=1 Tax=Frankia tisae TaxID=2950104 RepID=UPI0021BE9BD8|nr:acyl-CoA synthetase [Frankia tisae]
MPQGAGAAMLGELSRHPADRLAVVMADGSAQRTFGELERHSRKVAHLLAGYGLRHGDHVAILLPNRPEYFEAAWGAQRSGLYWTPVNWHLTAEETAHIVDDCGARVLFTSAELAPIVKRVRESAAALEHIVMIDAGPADIAEGIVDYRAALAGQPDSEPADQAEGIYMFYSSGTTGRPKGIEPALPLNPYGTGLAIDQAMVGSFGFGPDSVYLCPAPLYHAAPTGWSTATQRLGGTVILMERFDPSEALRAIERYRVTHVQVVPTMFVRLLKLPAAQRTAFDLSSLRLVVHAAAPCPPEVKQQVIDWLGPIVFEYYAGSEGGGMCALTSQEWLTHRGSVGRAVIGVVHIVGEDGAELPVGEIGRVYFESPTRMEYHNDPERTAAAYDDRGWLTLGDLGHLDADGYLYLADRRTDLVISGGVNIYPQEIENALILHPAVADVAVIGVPDAEMGQRLLAVVQPAAEAVAGPELAAELQAFGRERLAGFKVPRTVEFVEELPRLPTGKLQRVRLRERYAG